TFDDAIILPSDRHDGTQVLRHNGAASQVIKDSAPDNTDQNVTQWIEARFPTRVVLTDDRYHFGFEVQIPQSHLRVMIRRMKNRPEYITILNRIGMTDEQRTKLKGMPDQEREPLLRTINLECSRLKIEPHF